MINSLVFRIASGLILLLNTLPALAQLDVTYPVSRMVVQRNNSNQATVQIAGSYAQAIDVIEARAVARQAGQGTTTAWTVIQSNPVNGQFNGNMQISGGWYQLEVRGLRGGQVVASDLVDRFGVGEVFAIVGHSNAQGSGCFIGNVDYCTTREGALDDRVTVVPVNSGSPEFLQYEQTADTYYLPGLNFGQLATFSGISPFAKIAWLWGRMGDMLVQRINVPVLLYNAGFGGTNMEHNYKAAYDIPFEHGFCRYDLRMPFVNLRNLMNLYVPSTGLRAVLLQHGENDRENSTPTIVTHHYGVIDKSRQEFNKPNLAWIIAISSFFEYPFYNVRSAQFEVINRPNYLTFQGPDLDNINSVEDRPDRLHYSASGQTKAGDMWANAITDAYLQTIQPYLAEPQPITSIACAPGNQLTLTQPGGYTYNWNTGSTDASLTVGNGTYSARLRNTQNKIAFPPAVTVPSIVRPATPTISGNNSAFCLPGSVTLTSNYAGPNLWNTGASTVSLAVPAPGNYSVQARHPAYGCLSESATTTVSAAGTDLSLSLRPSRTSLAVNDTVTFTLTIRNEGTCEAGNVTVQNQLPPNLQFVSSASLTASNGIVSGTLSNVSVGQSISRQYVARLTAPGSYQNAAQLVAQAGPDPDSQPNSGTSDGQDDASTATLRTRNENDLATVYTSPNPNPAGLPSVQSNQPAPDPNRADLSLHMKASSRFVRAGQSVTMTLTVRNRGGLTATGINLQHLLPSGMEFVSSTSGMTASGATVSGSIGSVADSQEASISFVARVTNLNSFINKAQITSFGQTDPDSQPGNGYDNGEDDTDQLILRSAGSAGARLSATVPSTPLPNPGKVPAKSIEHRFSGKTSPK